MKHPIIAPNPETIPALAAGGRPMAKKTRAGKPSGARNCFRSLHVSGPCATCGESGSPVHIPLQIRSIFCPTHCPVCSAPTNAAAHDKELFHA